MRIALVSAQEAMGLDTDLPLLTEALRTHGADASVVAWDDPNARWATFDLAVVRSTWDYVPRRDEFVAWARRLPCPLANSADVLAWNTDKTYLRELEASGLAIVPTVWFEASDQLHGAARRLDHPALADARDVVVKPSISAGSRDTARFPAGAHHDIAAHVDRILASKRPVMLQRYIDSVDERGETGLLFFDGKFSHAIHKAALLEERGDANVTGLFAVERIAARNPTPQELQFARKTLALLPFSAPTLYARVDVVDDRGTLRLLELELTEPSCFLDVDGEAAGRFADAIVSRVKAR